MRAFFEAYVRALGEVLGMVLVVVGAIFLLVGPTFLVVWLGIAHGWNGFLIAAATLLVGVLWIPFSSALLGWLIEA